MKTLLILICLCAAAAGCTKSTTAPNPSSSSVSLIGQWHRHGYNPGEDIMTVTKDSIRESSQSSMAYRYVASIDTVYAVTGTTVASKYWYRLSNDTLQLFPTKAPAGARITYQTLTRL